MRVTELSYQESLHLFETWGFRVEPGPGADEVSLILETPDSCTYTVHPKAVLPEMAALSLAVRWRNQQVVSWTGLMKGRVLADVNVSRAE